MRQSYGMVLLGTFVSAAAPIAAASLPRGVGPECEYQSAAGHPRLTYMEHLGHFKST